MNSKNRNTMKKNKLIYVLGALLSVWGLFRVI